MLLFLKYFHLNDSVHSMLVFIVSEQLYFLTLGVFIGHNTMQGSWEDGVEVVGDRELIFISYAFFAKLVLMEVS